MTGPGGGDPAAARDLFAALRPVFERVLGLEHPPAQAAVRYVPALSSPARLRSSTHDAVAACYRFVT